MPAARATLPLFSLTIFLGAALLFLLQLVFARMVLPFLGGAPAVWNTAMVFYQAALLAGYGYAHWLGRRTRRLPVHALVLLAGGACLPFAVTEGWTPPPDGHPAVALIGLLAVSVGLPFFAVSATSPLLQRWFASTGHPDSGDPYFLYAAGNAGSLLGLLAYPFAIEPWTSLGWQSGAWSVGFVMLAGLSLACGWSARSGSPSDEIRSSSAPGSRRRIRWVALAAVPSSLLLSVTSYVSGEIAAVPLLWVMPLALYLATFVHAFSRGRTIPGTFLRRMVPVLAIPVALALAMDWTTPLLLLAALHFAAFAAIGLACHGELAADRPEPDQLTLFYFCLSLGGVLGGAFTALLGPLLFDGMEEYPLMLVLGAWLILPRKKWSVRDPLLALAPVLPVVLCSHWPAGRAWFLGAALSLCFLMSGNGGRFALSLAAVLLAARMQVPAGTDVLIRERSFFGIHRVVESGGMRMLFHGKALHGMQSLDPEMSRVPLGYYHPEGPLGRIFAGEKGTGAVSIVGLGTGAAAAYGTPGREFLFHEIDPVVIRIATDPRYFSYLADSPADVRVVAGDARLTLRNVGEGSRGLIVLDAYSSDSIPVHLLTREALALYRRKLAPGGWIALHLSNLHLDLAPVVAALARDAGMACLLTDDDDPAPGGSDSRWAVLAESSADLSPLDPTGFWTPPYDDGRPVWTDDHSGILPLLGPGK